MDNLVTISNTRENILEFDVDIQGLDTDDAKVRFIIHADKVCFSFPCVKEDKKWTVTIPQLSYLERTAFPFCIEIIADGYFFEALRGTVNVVGSADVYATAPKNTAMPVQSQGAEEVTIVAVPESKDSKKKTVVKETPPVRARERSISLIAEQLMREQGVNVRSSDAPKETPKPANERDEKVRAILKESKTPMSKVPFRKGEVVTR